tara:strand:- start:1084 stop:1698 length:615 start_codon:yes stop_codon:yes gene_type:complete
MNENNILGVVLSGGKSKRFGEDKSEVFLGNRTLLEHTLIKINPKFNEVIIVSNKVYKNNYINIKDCIDGNLGPLVAVLSAMKWIKDNNKPYDWIATFPCDTPFFNNSIIDNFILASKKKDSLLYFAQSKEKRHNIFGLWSIELIKILENDIVEKKYRKVEEWANKIGVKLINVSNISDDNSFLNINTKEDFKKAEKIINKIKND